MPKLYSKYIHFKIYNMLLGENIRKLRVNSTRLSQQDMADQLGVDRNTYANWEKGENDIKSEYIPKLADLLGVKIQDLFRSEAKDINIIQEHNEGKDNSILNGAIIILTDKDAVDKLVNLIKDKIE